MAFYPVFFAVGTVAANDFLPQLQIEERVEYYDVAASDRQTLIKKLGVPGEGNRGAHGLTQAVLTTEIRFTQTPRQCVIDALAIRLELKVTLPRWAPGVALPRSVAKDWATIRDQIAAHEEKHKQNALNAAFAMRDGFASAAKAHDCRGVEAALRLVQARALNKQQMMDRLLDELPVIRK